jgi:hypothetical protein
VAHPQQADGRFVIQKFPAAKCGSGNYTDAYSPHNLPMDASNVVHLLVNNTDEAPIAGI